HVAERVAWCFQNVKLEGTEFQPVALFHLDVDAWNFVCLFFGAIDRAAGLSLKRLVARHMVEVVVSRKDMSKLPARFLQRLADGRLIGRVDGSGNARGLIMD